MMPLDAATRLRSNHNNGDAKLALNELNEIVGNALLSRQEWLRKLMDPRKSINDECGYPETISPQEYRQLYDRFSIAARVVQVMPNESWQAQPEIYEDEDADVITPFEEAWDAISSSLRGQSWYKDEEGNPVWEALRRADELSGIGSYGVLLIGIDDGLPLDQPVKGIKEENTYPVGYDETNKVPYYYNGQYPKTGGPVYNLVVNAEKTKGRKIVFLKPFDEVSAAIVQWESNPSSLRFCQPVMYSLTFNDPSSQDLGGMGLPISTMMVHWTRVIHLADTSHQGSSSDIVVPPRMRAVFNHLLDLVKLYGGSAEMYWRGAFPGYSMETHPQLGGDVDVDIDKTKDQMEQYMNTLQRYIISSGMSVKPLAPQVVDPTPQIKVQIEAICIKLRIPMRIFMGSERGELASSQDDSTWLDVLRDRQCNYLTPRVIIPFIDRLIKMGVLPEPSEEGYHVTWPDLDSLSEAEQADIAVKRVTALTTYVSGQGEAMITPLDFWTRIMHMSEEEATAIIEAVQKHLEEANPDTDDEIVPGHIPAPPAPEPEPGSPIKMKEGEALVGPDGTPMTQIPKSKTPA